MTRPPTKTIWWQRKWFIRGVGLLAIGLFTTLYSLNQRATMEREMPELMLGLSEADRLERVRQMELMENNPLNQPGSAWADCPQLDLIKMDQMTSAQQDRFKVCAKQRFIYRNARFYAFAGYLFMILGLLFAAASFREPTLPDLVSDLEQQQPGQTQPPEQS